MFAQSLFTLALALSATAIQITAPTNSSGWQSEGSHRIEWDVVSTDPSNFTIQLITPSSPNEPVTIAEGVQSSEQSYTYTPSSDLSAGDQYRVNFVSTSNSGILAQSDYFTVEEGSSTVSASSASQSSTSTSASSASTSSGASATSSNASQTSSGASSASSAAASASKSGSASSLVAPTGLLAILAMALGVLA